MARKSKSNRVPLSEAALHFAPRSLIGKYNKLQKSQFPEFPAVDADNPPQAIRQFFGGIKSQIDHLKTRNQPMWRMQQLLIDALLSEKLKAYGIQTEPIVSSLPEMIPSFFFKNIIEVEWKKGALVNFGRRFEGVEIMRSDVAPRELASVSTSKQRGRISKSSEIYRAIEGLINSGVDLNSISRPEAIHAVRQYAEKELGANTKYGYSLSVIQRCISRKIGPRV